MKPQRLTDDALADALVVSGATGSRGTPCPPESRIWDAFQGRLAPAEVASLLDHAASCAECSLAMRVAQAMGADPAADAAVDRAPGVAARIWQGLAGTILRPAPALAYLLLLAISFPLYRQWVEREAPDRSAPVAAPSAPSVVPAAPAAPAIATPRIVRLAGDLELRGESAAPATRLALAPGETVLLKVFPDLTDAPSGGTPLLVRLLEGSTLVSETARAAAELEPDGSLSILLDGRGLASGATYVLEVRSGPSSGEPVFRQTFSIVRAPRPGE